MRTPIHPVMVGMTLFALATATVAGGSWLLHGQPSPFRSGTLPESFARYLGGGNYGDGGAGVARGGQSVVFSSPHSGNGDLYQVSMKGGLPTPLLRSPEMESSPRFSPDGKTIAFLREGAPQFGKPPAIAIWVMDKNGQHLRRLTGSEADYLDLTFMPDGKTLLVTRVAVGNVGYASTCFLDLATGKTRPDGCGVLFDAAPTPDGQIIYYTDGAANQRTSFISRFDRKKKTARRMVDGNMPSVSPDGRFLAFLAGPYDQELRLMRTDGTGERRLYEHNRSNLSHPVCENDYVIVSERDRSRTSHLLRIDSVTAQARDITSSQ